MRYLASWALYWAGDATYQTLRTLGFGCIGAYTLYATYNRLMCWSSDAQGDGAGPWSPVIEGARD